LPHDGGKWREIGISVPTMHSSQQAFNRVREAIAKQTALAEESGVPPYFSPGQGEDADAATIQDELGTQALDLHERLLQEAEPCPEGTVSSAFSLDVDTLLERLTATRFLSNEALEGISAGLQAVADARAFLGRVEADRYDLFVRRDSEGDDGADAVADRLPGLLKAQTAASQAETAALDQLVAAFAQLG
jgi:hypothetical protein